METKKVCFKCGLEKSLSEYYVHKQMADGHLNKCKECAKNDVRVSYDKNIEDIKYLEKERKRGRDKYAKYKYKSKIQHTENRSTASFLRKQWIDLSCREVHHWNYNLKNDVFILHPRAHALIHKYITFDKQTNMFKDKNGVLIDTKQFHFYLIKNIFEINNVNYEVDVYPLPFN